MSVVTFKRGDDAQDLLYQLEGYDAAGNKVVQELSGVVKVALWISGIGEKAATVEELTPGQWWVRVSADELSGLAVRERGYHMETEVLFANGTRQTYPNGGDGAPKYDTLIVVEDLGDATP